MILWLLACASPCPQDTLSAGGECLPYEPDAPLQAEVWQPAPGTTWQIQYSGTLDTSLDVEVYNIDLFDTTAAQLSALSDRVVLCYFSAGSYEDWRDDAEDFPESTLGRPLDGWPGEWWLDIRDPSVRQIMEARLDLALSRGCTGVDPDNVNGWQNPTGFDLTQADQLEYNRWLADAAHSRGLSVGLKNDQSQAAELLDWFDWAVNEECVAYQECGDYALFTDADKAVFHIEYVDDWADAEALADEVCGQGPNLDTLIKQWDLGVERLACEREG